MLKRMSAPARIISAFLALLLAATFAWPMAAVAVDQPIVTYYATPGKFAAEGDGEPQATKTQNVTATAPTIIIDDVPTVESAEYEVPLVFNANEGQFSDGATTKDGKNSHVLALTFKEWNDKNTFDGTAYKGGDDYSKYENLDLYAEYTETDTVTSDKFPEATREGYTLTGWFKAPSGGDKVGDAGDDVPADTALADNERSVTFYAQWREAAAKVKVTFVGMDDQVIEVQEIDYGSDATAPSVPVVDGYAFTGWDSSFTNVTEDITVKALYAEKKYKVVFNANGGEGSLPEDIPFAEGEKVILPTTTLTKSGYTFAGWCLDADGEGTVREARTVVEGLEEEADDSGVVTFYAQWKATSTTSVSEGSSGGVSNTGDMVLVGVGIAAAIVVAIAAGSALSRKRR